MITSQERKFALNVIVRIVENERDLERALAIRREVFVLEQGVPEDLEIDEWEPSSTHFLAWAGEAPVGTCRLRMLDPSTGKAERVAVLKSVRDAGVGRKLMEACEHHARQAGAKSLILNAQIQVVPFYEKLGYVPVGDPFMEAGIRHIKMKKDL
jgi:predicted GNAT family N-acyltransferase